MPTSTNIERALGVVIGKLESIEDRLHRQDESRAALHKRMDDLVVRTTSLESEVTGIKGTIRDVQKVTEEVKAWKQRGIGALAIVGMGASALTWLITTYFDTIMRMLGRN
ncbi:MAG TPA: DUF1515 family protein [Hyphomicrobiaceae bacterium]